MSRYDVIVIGGGCNGTGTARDCAMRGLRTLLLDKGDLGAATTGHSSGMIHGGIRYLAQYDFRTTYHSSIDSGFIQRIAPYMIFRIPFIMPFVAPPTNARPWTRWKQRFELEKVAAGFRAYDHFAALKRGKPSARLSADEVARLEPGIRRDVMGGVTMDEWGIDPFRLCVANARSARKHGAEIRTYTRVEGFLREDGERGAVTGVRTVDVLTGERATFHASMIVNATGPWLPLTAKLGGFETENVRLRPSKGVHLTLDRRLSNFAVVASAVDGRQIFLMPHENESVIGTTDDDYYGNLDDIPITQDEVEYLLQGVESVFPEVRRARVVRAWAGARPTMYKYGPTEDELSRGHRIVDHAKEGAPGLVSIAGGKLAAYRLMSEEATDLVSEKMGVERPCTTHIEPLPGGESELHVPRWADTHRVPMPIVERLAFRHGTDARKILQLLDDRPDYAAVVCQCEGIIEAEVRYCIRHEWVRRAQDLKRRCRVGAGPCNGARCALRAAAILGEERLLPARAVLAEARDFVEFLWRGARPVLGGAQVAQEELGRALHFGVGAFSTPPAASAPGAQAGRASEGAKAGGKTADAGGAA